MALLKELAIYFLDGICILLLLGIFAALLEQGNDDGNDDYLEWLEEEREDKKRREKRCHDKDRKE